MNVKLINLLDNPFLMMWSAYITGETDFEPSEIHAPMSLEKMKAFETLRMSLIESKAMDKIKIINRFKGEIEKGNEKMFEFCTMIFSVEGISKSIVPRIDIKGVKIICNNTDTEKINLILSCDLKSFRNFYFIKTADYYKEGELKELAKSMMIPIKQCFDTYEDGVGWHSFVDYYFEEDK